MSSISTYLEYIQTKKWASEVRTAIVNAISQCYSDVSNPTLLTEGIESILGDMVDNGRISLAIMNDLGLITERTDNLFDFSTVEAGRLNTSTGEITETSGYWVSDYIPVENGKTYYFANTDRRVAYNSSEIYSANISGTMWTASENGYIRVSVTSANRKTAKINEGSNKAYRPGRAPIDYNLRNDVYRKAEIDTMLGTIVVGLTNELNGTLDTKVDLPSNGYGTSGKVLRSTGTGTEWAAVGQPTDEQTAEAVSDWLDEHPEATTTVQDGSLVEEKLSESLKEKVVHNYVTPQMYGAKADGTTDDSTAIQNALNYLNTRGGGIIYFPVGIYLINSSVQSYPNIIMTGEGNGSIIKIGVSEVSLITANNNVVKNLGFDGNATVLSGRPTMNTILNARGANIIVKDCYFLDAIGSCVASSAGNNVKVLHNTMNGYGDHAVYFSTNSSNIVVSHNIISRPNNDRGVEAIKFREGVNNVLINNNIALNVPCFLMLDSSGEVACDNVIVIGNRATTMNHSFLALTSGVQHKNVIIASNVFENIGNYVALSLIWNGYDGCQNITICDNIFKNYTEVGSIAGVTDDGIKNLSILRNVFDFAERSEDIRLRLGKGQNVRIIGNTFTGQDKVTTFMTAANNTNAEIKDNAFYVGATWLFNLVNRSNIKITFTGNTVKQLTRRLINGANITGNSLVVIKGNNILDDSTSYPYFYDRSSVSDPTKYLIKDNIVNGVDYNPSMIAYIPSYVGQMCVNNGIAYIAVGTTATTDWIALNTAV